MSAWFAIVASAFFAFAVLFFAYNIFVFRRTRVPYMATPRRRYPFIFENLQINPSTVVYDLGCGKGDFLFAAEKKGAGTLVGYELSPVHVLCGKAMAKLKGSRVKIYKKDYFKADISQADVIYLFLTPPAVEKLVPKLQKEAKPGATVISLGAPIEKLSDPRIIETEPEGKHRVRLYFYKTENSHDTLVLGRSPEPER